MRYLVGGLEPWNFMTSHSVGNVILPTDELIFFRGVAQPPTSYDCYGNLIPLCTTGLSTPPLRRRFLRQRLAVQISIDLELFLVWSRLIFFKHSWEMLGMWGELMEMSTMLASIVLFMFFFPHDILNHISIFMVIFGDIWLHAHDIPIFWYCKISNRKTPATRWAPFNENNRKKSPIKPKDQQLTNQLGYHTSAQISEICL